ncbi:MAG: aldehyde dehydrogenase, partial [Chloroflexi bacterium]
KSPCIVFADADIELAAERIPYSVFANAGQDCCARTRILVERSVLPRFSELFVARTSRLRVGDPLSEATEIGSMVSPGQKRQALQYLELGVQEGAAVLTGGEPGAGFGLERGSFVLPAVLGDVDNRMRVAREEIFGPVACLIPFAGEDEAVSLANASPYGLSGSIWSRDIGRALRTARRVRSGVLSINTNSSVHIEAPFGGYKQSGIGRELGLHALSLYTEVKNIYVDLG